MDNRQRGVRVAIVLVSLGTSGTERRMAFVFDHLARLCPGKFLLVIDRALYERLRSAGFRMSAASDVHILEGRFPLDRKRRAGEGPLVNLGRIATLLQYRFEIARVMRRRGIGTVQVFLEMVPVLGLWPIRGVRQIASLVSHLPKYYDGRSLSSRLLVRYLKRYDQVDALYEYISRSLLDLGLDPRRVTTPNWNCVDHVRFRPEPKEDIVTFTGRALNFKHPELVLHAVEQVSEGLGRTRFFVLGEGPMSAQLIREAEQRGLSERVQIGYVPDPSPIVNRSRVHVCVEEHDNLTNQSLLEGMASGCAIVASDVGLTSKLVTPDIGILVPLDPRVVGDAVLSLLSDPGRCQAMGVAAREKILRDHNVDRYAEYLMNLYDEAGAIG